MKVDNNFDRFRPALLAWRNTPRADGFSPAQMFFGHAQLFGHPMVGSPRFIDRAAVGEKRVDQSLNAKKSFDKRTRALPELLVGTRVVVQDVKTGRWLQKASILAISSDGRSYDLRLDGGAETSRNRVYIRPIKD